MMHEFNSNADYLLFINSKSTRYSTPEDPSQSFLLYTDDDLSDSILLKDDDGEEEENVVIDKSTNSTCSNFNINGTQISQSSIDDFIMSRLNVNGDRDIDDQNSLIDSLIFNGVNNGTYQVIKEQASINSTTNNETTTQQSTTTATSTTSKKNKKKKKSASTNNLSTTTSLENQQQQQQQRRPKTVSASSSAETLIGLGGSSFSETMMTGKISKLDADGGESRYPLLSNSNSFYNSVYPTSLNPSHYFPGTKILLPMNSFKSSSSIKQQPVVIDKSDFLPDFLTNPHTKLKKSKSKSSGDLTSNSSTMSVKKLNKKKSKKKIKNQQQSNNNNNNNSTTPLILPSVSIVDGEKVEKEEDDEAFTSIQQNENIQTLLDIDDVIAKLFKESFELTNREEETEEEESLSTTTDLDNIVNEEEVVLEADNEKNEVLLSMGSIDDKEILDLESTPEVQKTPQHTTLKFGDVLLTTPSKEEQHFLPTSGAGGFIVENSQIRWLVVSKALPPPPKVCLLKGTDGVAASDEIYFGEIFVANVEEKIGSIKKEGFQFKKDEVKEVGLCAEEENEDEKEEEKKEKEEEIVLEKKNKNLMHLFTSISTDVDLDDHSQSLGYLLWLDKRWKQSLGLE